MRRNIFLMAALIGLVPGFVYVGKNVPGFASPPLAGLKQERLEIAEGSLTDVNPESQTVRIKTPEGAPMVFRYNKRTLVEGMEETVAGCFGPKNERNVRVQFRTADGASLAVRIELLPKPT